MLEAMRPDDIEVTVGPRGYASALPINTRLSLEKGSAGYEVRADEAAGLFPRRGVGVTDPICHRHQVSWKSSVMRGPLGTSLLD